MKKINPYLIKVAYVPFKDKHGGKSRPILMHRINDKFIKLWVITTKYLTKSPFIRLQYFPIFKWHPYGLNRTSYVDIKNERTLPYSLYKQLSLCKQDPMWYFDHEDINSFEDFCTSYSYRVKASKSTK